MDLSADARLAADLVREAGEIAARIRDEGLDIRSKSSASDVVTQADLAAEKHITDRLRVERPDDGIVGEEGAAHTGTSGRRWVIDPVDGTFNFTRGSDWWCCAIALDGPDDVLLGAVGHVSSQRTWLGGPTLPTTCNDRPVDEVQETQREHRCAVTYLHPPFYSGEVGAAFARALEQVGTLRMLGSGTMDNMAILAGQFDVLFQHSVTEWDRLPGAAIVRGAGGESRVVPAAGVDWTVTGAPLAVADVVRALTGDGASHSD